MRYSVVWSSLPCVMRRLESSLQASIQCASQRLCLTIAVNLTPQYEAKEARLFRDHPKIALRCWVEIYSFEWNSNLKGSLIVRDITSYIFNNHLSREDWQGTGSSLQFVYLFCYPPPTDHWSFVHLAWKSKRLTGKETFWRFIIQQQMLSLMPVTQLTFVVRTFHYR